jgi:hypothetical protein
MYEVSEVVLYTYTFKDSWRIIVLTCISMTQLYTAAFRPQKPEPAQWKLGMGDRDSTVAWSPALVGTSKF